MLVLSRKVGQRLFIGDDIIITVADIRADKVRFGVTAPKHMNIAREELLARNEQDEKPTPNLGEED